MRIPDYTQEHIETRLRYGLLLANADQIGRGKNWYKSAHNLCHDSALALNIDFNIFVAIVAALSPNARWTQNVKDAVNLVASDGEANVTTYNRNKETAINILWENDISHLSGGKVVPFYNAIVNDKHGIPVIDTWAYIWLFPSNGNKQKLHLRMGEREGTIRAFHNVAYQNNVTVAQLQAIIWIVCKEQTEAKNSQCFSNASEVLSLAQTAKQLADSIPGF